MAVYGALAAGVAALHGVIILVVVAGSAGAVAGRLHKKPRMATGFYGLVALVILSDRLLGDCVLTRLERSLREANAPGSSYPGSYIGHYFWFLPPFVHHWIGPALVITALLAYPVWVLSDRRAALIRPR